jgi:pantoate--beta-alanine ligase
MVDDLDVGVRIVAVPTVREPDGLAMSSRNRYLSAEEREQAGALSSALLAGRYAAGAGPAAVLDAARAVLDEVPAIRTEYLELRGPWLEPAPAVGPARLLLAARLGGTRLLDTVAIDLPAGGPTPESGSDSHEMTWRN